MKKIYLGIAVACLLTACNRDVNEKTAQPDTLPKTVEPLSEHSDIVTGSIEWALASEYRVSPERDIFRNPAETLTFFELEPNHTVVEIWPGGGWYTSILGPYLKHGGGKLYAAGFDPQASDYAKRSYDKYVATFVENPDIFGDITVSIASPGNREIAPMESADLVLTFRNFHNWMTFGFESDVLAQAYKALKPGGILGITDHRLPSTSEQDPEARSGYVHQELVVQLVEEAGFQFVDASEINANPKDTADHPFGVWTLPPVLRARTADGEDDPEFDHEPYIAIGESDRMTLKFRKPLKDDTDTVDGKIE